jgi:hypothetical protein
MPSNVVVYTFTIGLGRRRHRRTATDSAQQRDDRFRPRVRPERPKRARAALEHEADVVLRTASLHSRRRPGGSTIITTVLQTIVSTVDLGRPSPRRCGAEG